MAKIDWKSTGKRFYETGVDRGVLYVGDGPGVPWTGLVNVNDSQSGGEIKTRFLDGVMISNRASPETFVGTIEAFTYPPEFEKCDGSALLQNGLRTTRQRRHLFHLVYRTKVGDDLSGLDRAYKIHILYNVRAEPSERSYRTLSDQNEPITFSWRIFARGQLVAGIRPSPHFVIDSRDVPALLLEDVEELLYGTEATDPSLPTAGELIFLFDSFEDMVYDAGGPYTPVFATYDAGGPDDPYDNTIDGGAL